jgi:ribosome-associated heat shock protein Hsp15
MDKLRLDKYLWAIRVFKTRGQAAEACEKGKVRIEGVAAKAAKTVRIGETYEVKSETRRWVVKVTGLLEKRVQFSEAVKYYEDLTPVEEKERLAFQAAVFYSGKRQTKIGRPTKKQRRELGDFLEDEPPVNPQP